MSQLNETYYIAPGAVRITPNAISVDGDAHRYVAISVTTGTLIMLSVSHYSESLGINYTSGLNNPTWRLVGYSTQLNAEYNDKVVYIYARLEVGAANGILILSPNDYTTSETGSEQTAVKRGDYIFVKLGYLTAPVEGLRSLQFDSGCLLTQYANDLKENNLGGFFALVGNAIQPLKNFVELTINKTLTVRGTLETNILSLANKVVKGIDDSTISDAASDDHLATSGYVDANALSSKTDDTAQGKITFSQGINIGSQDITDIDVAEDVPVGGYTDKDVTDNAVPSTSAMVLHTREHGDANYLSKVKDDSAEGKITFKAKQQFDQGFEVGEYKDGDFGTGGAINVDENGNSYLEVDYGKFRKKVTFNDLEIKSLKHVGGTVLLSPASATLAGVVTRVDRVFACYFRKTDGDGKSIKNEWQVGDQARCQSFDVDAQRQTYYWRLVVGVDYVQSNDYPSSDYHCILLSQTDCDFGSDIPSAGDEIVQLGNTSDDKRQMAIMLSAYDIDGTSAPCIIQYEGINSYSLLGCEKQRWSPGNNLFDGKVVIQPDSEGWENLSGLNDKLQAIEINAAEASNLLKGWIADGVISPLEKQSIKDELVRVQATYEELSSSYELYESAINDNVWTEYLDAYNEYTDILSMLTNNMKDTSVVPENFEEIQSLYYNKAAALSKAINKAANDKLVEALDGFVDTNAKFDELSVSNTNLLRNSGFYGDTKSKAILGDTMMSTDTELYSPSLEYWTASNAVAYPSDANEEGAETTPTITDSKSGYYCKITNGYISQIIGTALVDEDYIISFRGVGDFTIGFVGNTEKVTLTDTSTRYIIRCKAKTTTVNAILRIEGTGSICEIMLERGNVPSNTWNRSTLDASNELSRFHNLEYLTQAIQEGSTTMMGGLILSNILMLGNYVNGVMKQVTSGISGTYNQGDDVSYWAGGSLENAIYTATKLLKNPFYQFTEEEKKNLANAIITHGGTAIFNEAIVRGTVYATNGIFTGEVNATSGTFNNVTINDNVIIRGKFNRVVQHITQENFEDFFYPVNYLFYAFLKVGAGFDNNGIYALPTYMHAWADIIYWDGRENGNNEITMALPCIYKYTSYDYETGISEILTKPIIGKVKDNGVSRDMEYNDVMSLVGREIVLFNNTTANIYIYASLIKPANYGTEEGATYKTIIIDPVNSTGEWFHGYTDLTDTNDKNPSITRYTIGGQNAAILKCVMVRRYLQDTYQGKEVSGFVDMIGWILTRFDRQLS